MINCRIIASAYNLTLAFLLLAQVPATAQSESNWSVGFTAGVTAITDFGEGQPFALDVPLFIGTTYLTGNWAISPYYNLGANGLGGFVTYTFTDNFSAYLVNDNSLDNNFGLIGFGAMTPTVGNWAQAFLEVGSTYGKSSGVYLATGVWLTFGKSL